MTPNFAEKSAKELENMVDNYRRRGQTSSEIYQSLLRELELKRGKGLDLEKTLDCVTGAAREHRFVSYKDVAAASGVPMAKARLAFTNHLYALCEYATIKGLPLLSAIVVNVDGVQTGTMNAEARAGFLKAARDLGAEVTDEEAFVRAEQEKIFAFFAADAHA